MSRLLFIAILLLVMAGVMAVGVTAALKLRDQVAARDARDQELIDGRRPSPPVDTSASSGGASSTDSDTPQSAPAETTLEGDPSIAVERPPEASLPERASALPSSAAERTPEALPAEPTPDVSAFTFDVRAESPLWAEQYDPKYPIPFTSSTVANFLTVTLVVINSGHHESAMPEVHLVDADGQLLEGFGPSGDRTDFPISKAVAAGQSVRGYFTFPVANAAAPLKIRFRSHDVEKTIELPNHRGSSGSEADPATTQEQVPCK